jgi:hypothetical protein
VPSFGSDSPAAVHHLALHVDARRGPQVGRRIATGTVAQLRQDLRTQVIVAQVSKIDHAPSDEPVAGARRRRSSSLAT